MKQVLNCVIPATKANNSLTRHSAWAALYVLHGFHNGKNDDNIEQILPSALVPTEL